MYFYVTLELTEGFTLDVDQLNVGVLGYLSQQITEPVLSVDCKRGKNRELDRYSAGTCTITFDNRSGNFNPTNASSPLYGSIYPGRRIQVSFLDPANGYILPIFTGFTGDWNYSFELGGNATASVTCVDGFAQLANREIVDLVVPAETTGARIQRILTSSQVNYSAADLDIDPGYSLCAAGTISGNALELIQQCELTEQGQLYIANTGIIRFIERNPTLNSTDYNLADTSVITGANYLGYQSIDVEYNTDTLVNYASATSPAGSSISQNSESIIAYQAQSKDFQTLHDSLTDLGLFTTYIVSEFGTPEYRIAQVNVNVDAYIGTQWSTFLANTDLGWLTTVYFGPPGTTDLIQEQKIIGVTHRATPSRYDIALTLERAIGISAFRLDDAQYGILNVNELAY